MTDLVVIIGPQAVGKMTIGEKLKEKIGYTLMTNHDSIEIAIKIFSSNKDAKLKLKSKIREDVFNICLENNISIIFTFVVDFNTNDDILYLNELKNKFEKTGGHFYLIELEADLQTRLERNKTPHRLECKPSKKNIEWSEKELIESMNIYRMNSIKDEIKFENYIKINNTNLSPNAVCDIIINKFNFNLNKI
jgi:hypothetical protein